MSERRKILLQFEENKDYINARIAEGVERHRKGNAKIKLVDKDGRAVCGKRIEIKQKSHAFLYGANIFMLDEFESDEKNKLYRERFSELCNMATLPFYWRDLELEKGNPRYKKDSKRVYRRPPLDLCIEYCEENGIQPKEHCLVYEEWIPEWVDKSDLNEMKSLLEVRISDLAKHYGDKIKDWEVINETLHTFKEPSALYNQHDLVEWSFACAEKYLKGNSLIINDAHWNIWNIFNWRRSAYYMQIERAMMKGARIDKIGMQFHMFCRREDEYEGTKIYYDPKNIYNVLDCYSEFGKPIQITEVTIPAYSYEEEDEQIQAEIVKWLYSIWFSHGAVDMITYWNLVDGYAAYAPQGDMTVGENYYHGGLLRFDLSPKPAFFAVKDLFEKQFCTNEEGKTDENGEISFRGFFGDYEISIMDSEVTSSKRITLSRDKENDFQIIV